jgi:predicted NAD/FAD-binding protein
VVGSGIAGLGAAYLLSRAHDVELYEHDERLGGHTHTVVHRGASGQKLALDTGFLVHNDENYPNLVRLFGELGVATQASEMSFSVSCARCGLEYSGARPWFQGRNLLTPGFVPLMLEIVRFMRSGASAVRDDESLAQFVARNRYSRAFRDHFLLPLTAALWSTAPDATLDFPAAHAVRFFENHGMLRFRRFHWRTVVDGSHSYVTAIVSRLKRTPHVETGVATIRRDPDGVELTLTGGDRQRFDAVVIATHAHQALRLLADPSDDERAILGAFATSMNETILHTDERMLPTRPSARGAWNYRISDCHASSPTLTMTYDLNRLQSIDDPRRYMVSLNRGAEIAEEHVIAKLMYAHPQYTHDTLRAQARLGRLNGVRRTWFSGAWQGNGFHEDGFASAIRAARDLGVRW